MGDDASGEYALRQDLAVHLAGEGAALRHTAKELHAEFAAAMAARDALLAEWHGALHRHDDAQSADTARQCQGLAQAVRDTDAELVTLTTARRGVSRQCRVLRHETSRATIHARRARRALDASLFVNRTQTPADARHGGKAETRSFFHDMREHLTIAVLAAGRLGEFALSPRITHVHSLLIRGLTGLTEDLDVLDPVPAVACRPALTLLPRPVSPPESTPIPGT